MKKKSKLLKKNKLSAKNKIRIKKFFTYDLPFNVGIIASILFTGWLCDKVIESLLFVASHFTLRYKFDKVLHCKDTLACLGTTTLINFVSILLTTRLEVSLIFACISAFGICWLGFIIEDWLELKIDNSNRIKIKEAPMYKGMNEDILRAKCKQVHLTKLATERIVKYYSHYYTVEELAVMEHVEVDTIKQSLKRSRRKLNIKEIE